MNENPEKEAIPSLILLGVDVDIKYWNKSDVVIFPDQENNKQDCEATGKSPLKTQYIILALQGHLIREARKENVLPTLRQAAWRMRSVSASPRCKNAMINSQFTTACMVVQSFMDCGLTPWIHRVASLSKFWLNNEMQDREFGILYLNVSAHRET